MLDFAVVKKYVRKMYINNEDAALDVDHVIKGRSLLRGGAANEKERRSKEVHLKTYISVNNYVNG